MRTCGSSGPGIAGGGGGSGSGSSFGGRLCASAPAANSARRKGERRRMNGFRSFNSTKGSPFPSLLRGNQEKPIGRTAECIKLVNGRKKRTQTSGGARAGHKSPAESSKNRRRARSACEAPGRGTAHDRRV